MKWIYSDGGRLAAGFKGEAGDCVTRAIAIAAELPYLDVYNALANYPRRTKKKASPRDGVHTKTKWFTEFMTGINWCWTATMFIGSGCKVHMRENELPTGRLIVNVSRHFCAVIDGVVYDTHDPTQEGNRCVYGYYRKHL